MLIDTRRQPLLSRARTSCSTRARQRRRRRASSSAPTRARRWRGSTVRRDIARSWSSSAANVSASMPARAAARRLEHAGRSRASASATIRPPISSSWCASRARRTTRDRGGARDFRARPGSRSRCATISPAASSTGWCGPISTRRCQKLDEGLATADDLDLTVRLGLGYPAGPIALLRAQRPRTSLRRERGAVRRLWRSGLRAGARARASPRTRQRSGKA